MVEFEEAGRRRPTAALPLARGALFSGIFGAVISLPSIGQVHKWGHGWGAVSAYEAAIFIVFALLSDLSRARRVLPGLTSTGRWLIGLTGLVILAFVILHPLSHSGRLGVGTDREDALNIAIDAIWRGEYPYRLRTYLGRPITPMPGALLLAMPFRLFGVSTAWQNLLWVPAFFILVFNYFGGRPSAVIFGLGYVLLQPAVMQDVVTGGDYIANFAYASIAVWLAYRALNDPSASQMSLFVRFAFLGVAIASRPPYAVLPLILAVSALRKGGDPRRVSLAVAVTCAVAAALILPFYLHDPAGFSPLHVAKMVHLFPGARWALPAFSVVIAAVAASRWPEEDQLFGVCCLALSPLFLPVLVQGIRLMHPNFIQYPVILSLWAGLWWGRQARPEESAALSEPSLNMPAPARSDR